MASIIVRTSHPNDNFSVIRQPGLRVNSAHALWKAMLNTAGQLGQILLDLAEEGKSLLGAYRCLKTN